MADTVKSYSDIDNIPEEQIKVELDVDKKTGTAKGYKKPAKKKWTVELDGKQFEVTSKVQRTLTKMWNDINVQVNEDDDEDEYTESVTFFYDPETLLKICEANDINPEGYTSDGTGVFIDAPIGDLFWGGKKTDVEKLSDDAIQKRINAFVYILMRCCDEDVANEIVARATKKKNRTLHKGRLQTIAHMNLVDESGETYVVVAKNDSDNKISIEVRKNGVNSTWLHEPDMFTTTSLFCE